MGQADLEELSMDYERTHAAAIITEKRGKNFDKVIGEWKAKADDIMAEVEASQKECRNYNSELYRLKAAYDEVVEQLDVVKRENKNLADEIKDLLDQLGDGGRSIHDLDKFAKRLIVASKRRKRSLTIPGRTTNVPWNLWVLHLRVNNVLRVKLFVSRKNWNLTSMSLKLPLIMPTRLMLRDKRPSKGTKDNSGIPSKAMRNKPVAVKKSWKLLELLNAKLML